MADLVSIVVPIYNAEKSLRKSIESVLNQTYTDIEVILVNDGSRDNSFRICEELKHEDDRIIVINKDNTGVSDTRNVGIANSKGKYILFLDADDYLQLDAIDSLVRKMVQYEADLCFFGFEVIGDDNRPNDTETLKSLKGCNHSSDEILSRILTTQEPLLGYIWRCMYSIELLLEKNITFAKGIKISEDYLFLVQAVHESQRIIIDDEEYYKYVINEGSMSIKYIPSLLHDMEFVNDYIRNNIVSGNAVLKHGMDCCSANTFMRYVQNEIRNKEGRISSTLSLLWNTRKKYLPVLKQAVLFEDFSKKDSIQIWALRNPLFFVYCLAFYVKTRLKG